MPGVLDLGGNGQAGALLLVGAVVFFSAFPIAVFRPELRSADAADFSVRLRAIAGSTRAWRAIFLLFGAGMILTAAAFVLLALDAHGREENLLAPLAAVSYVVGVVAMVVSMAFHAGPEIIAAQAIAQTGEVPPWYEPLERLASALYTVYMTLAFSALVLVAVSLWRTNSIAPPLAIAAGGFGLVMGVSFVTKWPSFAGFNPADLPLWVHVWAIFVGVALLFGD